MMKVFYAFCFVFILAVSFFGVFSVADDKASLERAKIKADLNIIQLYIDGYFVVNNAHPNSLDLLAPNYLKRIPSDPWGEEYEYLTIDSGYILSCCRREYIEERRKVN